MPAQRDLRRQHRKRILAMVRLVWQDSSGQDKSINAKGFDLCETGLSLETHEPLELRSYVTLRSTQLGLQGRGSVRHCSRHGGKYLVGIEFSCGLRWKPDANPEETRSSLLKLGQSLEPVLAAQAVAYAER